MCIFGNLFFFGGGGGGGGGGVIAFASACTLVLPKAVSLMLSLPSLFALTFVILLRVAGFTSTPGALRDLSCFFAVPLLCLEDLHLVQCLPGADPVLDFVQQTSLLEDRYQLRLS